MNTWEPVVIYIPKSRRGRAGPGGSIRDALVAPVLPRGFLGSKPPAWTKWVIEMLGFDQEIDQVTDIFTGSGAVFNTINNINMGAARPRSKEDSE